MARMKVFLRTKNGPTGSFVSCSVKGQFVNKSAIRHDHPIKDDQYYNVYLSKASWPTKEGQYNVFFKYGWIDEREATLNAGKHTIWLAEAELEFLCDLKETNTGNADPFEEAPKEEEPKMSKVELEAQREILEPKVPEVSKPKTFDISDEDLPF